MLTTPRESWPQGACRISGSVVVLLIATLIIFSPLTLHPTDLLVGTQRDGVNDLTSAFLAYRSFPAFERERTGQFPTWNPYSMCGRPWSGNPQAAPYYPMNWLLYSFRHPSAIGWLMVAHHFWAGLGVFALCRCYGLRQLPSLLGGIVFLGAPYIIAHTGEGHYNQSCVIAWIPWAMLAFERWRKQGTAGTLLLCSMLALSIFCGHIQEVFYLAIILTGSVGIDLIRAIRKGDHTTARGLIRRWAIVGLATAGLSCLEVLPDWFYSRQSIRGSGISLAEASEYSIGFQNLSQLVNPLGLGGPDDYTGPGQLYWETICYFGIFPLGLAIVGAVLAWKTYPTKRMVALGMLSIAFAFGTTGPFFPVMYYFVPGISLFRVPARALFLASLAVSVLAASGLQRLVEKAYPIPVERTARQQFRSWRLAWAVGLAFLCLVELACFAKFVLATIPGSSIRSESPVVAFLAPRVEHSRVLASHDLLSDREAWGAGIQKAQGYEPVPLQNYAMAMAAATDHSTAIQHATGFEPVHLESFHSSLVDLMGIRYAVLPAGSEPPSDRAWKQVAGGELLPEFTLRDRQANPAPYCIVENESVLPRAFVVGQAIQPEPGKDLLEQLRGLDPTREVLLDHDVLPDGPRSSFRPARIVEYHPTQVTIDAELDAPGYLFLSDIWYPGWRARNKGVTTPILRANIAFRAIPLPAGKHRVKLTYTPMLEPMTCGISFITLGMLLLGVWRTKPHPLP